MKIAKMTELELFMREKLLNSSWEEVLYEFSGVYRKLQFVLYTRNFEVETKEEFKFGDYANNIPQKINLKNYNWQLEYAGCLLRAGKLKKNSIKKSQVEEIVDEINDIVENIDMISISDLAEYNLNKNIIEQNILTENTKAVIDTHRIQDGDIVLVTNNFIKLKPQLSENRTFKIIYKDGIVKFTPVKLKLSGDEAYNIESVLDVQNLPNMEEDKFLIFLNKGLLTYFNVKISFKEEITGKWEFKNSNIDKRHMLLDELCNETFSPQQKIIINKALNKRWNVTYLLNNKLSAESMEVLTEFLKEDLDISFVNDFDDLGPDVLRFLKELVKQQYNIRNFLYNGVSVFDLNQKVSYLTDHNNPIRVRLSNDGYSEEKINFILKTTTFNIGLEHILGDMSLQTMILRDNAVRGYFDYLMPEIETKGIFDGYNIELEWKNISDISKNKLKILLFNIPDFDIDDKRWSDYIEVIWSKISSVVLTKNNILMFKMNFGGYTEYYLELLDNGIYIRDYISNIIFSTMYINDNLYVNNLNIEEVIFR